MPSHWTLYAEVDDLDAALARVRELGGTLLLGPDDSPYGRLAGVADPSGVPFKLLQATGAD